MPAGPRSRADHRARAAGSRGARASRSNCRPGAAKSGGLVNVRGRAMRTIWRAADGGTVEIIDQTLLPHELVILELQTLDDAARAIATMQVRGAPLIGAAAAYGVALAAAEDPSDRG